MITEHNADLDQDEKSAERAEIHFLAALVDELMAEMLRSGLMDRPKLNAIEAAVSKRIGNAPRTW